MATIGFDPLFLDVDQPVHLPMLHTTQHNELFRDHRQSPELKYPHFSLYLSAHRRFPYFTATNIDGAQFRRIARKTIFPSGRDEWSIDTRAAGFQWGQGLYSAQKSDFQRGHMTKREDPQWGADEAEARHAAQATFYFTNCVPQVGELNTQDWGKLETYILAKQSVPEKLRVSVLTGPVLSAKDPVFVTVVDDQEVQLPTMFWKIVYYSENGRTLSRAGFLMGQEASLYRKEIVVAKPRALVESDVDIALFHDFEDAAIYQVNIATIEKLSRLTFAPAKEPYQDDRPLKLIVEEVQVAIASDATEGVEAMGVDEETGKPFVIRNIRLATDVTPVASLQAESAPQDSPGVGLASNAGPQRQYTDEMKRHFGYYATWNPGTPLQLGDIGMLNGNVFTRISNLTSQGVQAAPAAPDTTPTDLHYSSRGSTNLSVKLAGTAATPGSSLATGDAGIQIEFTRENAVIFHARQTLTTTIQDTIALGKTILSMYQEGTWDKNWVVITELVSADSATILISRNAGTLVELKANANVNAPKLDLADASFHFSLSQNKQLETNIVAEKGLTPLFRVMGIHTGGIFGKPGFRPLGILSLDLLTPALAANKAFKEQITFGLIADSQDR